MVYPFVINALTTLIMGCALLLQWRKYPMARFARDIGLVYLALAAIPVLYAVYDHVDLAGEHWVLLAGWVLGVLYLTLLLLGITNLARRELSRGGLLAVGLAIALATGYPLALADLDLVSSVSGCIVVGVGLFASYWLCPGRRAERWVGPLLCVMGAVQFVHVLPLADAFAVQIAINTIVRLVLGLVLLHANLQRAVADAHRFSDKYERMILNSPQGVAVAYLREIVYCNTAFLRIYGIKSLAEVSPEWVSQGIPAAELAAVTQLRQQVLDGVLPEARFEGWRRRKDGTPLRLRFTVWRTEWDERPALQTVISDDTEYHNTLAAMLHRATHDDLTGLPNRSALLATLRSRFQASESFGLVLLDIDRFKLFNDAHGHSVGDAVLKAFAAALQRSLGDTVQISRPDSGGFALLTPVGSDVAQADRIAQQVRQMLTWPLVLPEQEFFVDVSMGIALFPQMGRDAESFLRAATAAMNEAKKIAGTSIVVADERFARGSGELLEQEQALRAGILNREFSLAYQPKVDATTGALVGLEALARWDRPGVGPVSPAQFIAAAERTGLIASLGLLLLSRVCEQVADWRAQLPGLVPVAVNVSPLQMHDPGFPQLVDGMLKQHGIAPGLISLEVTESVAIDNMEQARGQLMQLQQLGLKVAMDDFGTGFSSLAMLRSLPLHAVKIDRSLIVGMPAPDAVAVVRAICQLAEVLELRVIAEGVETEAQALAARQAGCHEIQGYFFARPLDPASALAWLQAGGRPSPQGAGVASGLPFSTT